MKRIREFTLTLHKEDGRITTQSVSGWHKVWEIAKRALEADTVEGRIHDSHLKRSPLIAVFSHHNFQDELAKIALEELSTRWRTEPLGKIRGVERFANTNVTDFGWSWIEGAKRDLPYRLSFLERQAERNPNGLMAFMLGLRAEARDLLRKV
jgi:hypothetical protein